MKKKTIMGRGYFTKTRTRTLLLVLGVLVGSLILSQCKSASSLDASNGQQLENSLLWEISGNGIKPSFVYGTFHLLPEADFNMTETITDAFDESAQVVLELDMDDPNMQIQMMQNMAMTDGTTLDQLMEEEDLRLLDEQLKAAAGLGADQVNSFKPFMVETFLLPTFVEGTPASYEISFVKRAVEQEKEILGLETVQFQTSLFDQIPYEDQVEDLVDMLRDRSEMEGLFASMIKTYNEGNISALYDASVDYFSQEETDILLHQRNKNWIPKIGELAADQSTFFAVGAGHLGGEQGVINLLRDAGYEVNPVSD